MLPTRDSPSGSKYFWLMMTSEEYSPQRTQSYAEEEGGKTGIFLLLSSSASSASSAVNRVLPGRLAERREQLLHDVVRLHPVAVRPEARAQAVPQYRARHVLDVLDRHVYPAVQQRVRL